MRNNDLELVKENAVALAKLFRMAKRFNRSVRLASTNIYRYRNGKGSEATATRACDTRDGLKDKLLDLIERVGE